MKHGFIKTAACTPEVRVADVMFNAEKIIDMIIEADRNGAKIAVFPELSITAYTCGDLFFQSSLLSMAKHAMLEIAEKTAGSDILSVVGLPLSIEDKLYNAAAFIKGGEILGFVTKTHLPSHGDYYEKRYFSSLLENTSVSVNGKKISAGPKLIFCASELDALRIGCEISEDLQALIPPCTYHAANGATLIVNTAASSEIAGKSDFRRTLLASQSARNICGYIYANAGQGESTTDAVYGGHSLIYESGVLLGEASPFSGDGIIYGDIDLEKIVQERKKSTFFTTASDSGYQRISFSVKPAVTILSRSFSMLPFIPQDKSKLKERCEEIFSVQCHGLKKRLSHLSLKTVTLGISGGLDSTLALLVAVKTFDALKIPRSGIIAVTMPCFGTTDRTYNNAKKMIESLGVQFREVNIKKAVTQHLNDIGADITEHDVTFENAQARERTQVLMDIANKTGGIVIGTGDLSELALGFATYNGDHISMYGVNADVPKTLIRYLVRYVADNSEPELKETLYDVLDTPVSPELLPPEEDGRIVQQTEEIVGPYELHDFFLFYMIRYGFSAGKILRLAVHAFNGIYSEETIEKWLKIFMRRFVNSQFKRSCLPDGPKVGSVALSPRGDWRMPSDATDGFISL